MRYILKNLEPASFTKWKKDYQTVLEVKYQTETGSKIWDWFTNKDKLNPNFVQIYQDLKETLQKEQGYICCYCGQDISNIPTAMDHFESKGVEKHKPKMFNYNNLMLACKMSHQITPSTIKFKETTGYENLITQKQISEKAKCTTKRLRDWNPNLPQDPRKDISEFIAEGADLKLHFRHCDDTKEDADVTEPNSYIFNPSQMLDCASKFKYNSDGQINLVSVDDVTKNNMLNKVLNLNAHNLCLLRASAYEAAQLDKDRLNEQLEKGQITEDDMIAEIDSQDFLDENNRRKPFCFIYTYVLSQLLA